MYDNFNCYNWLLEARGRWPVIGRVFGPFLARVVRSEERPCEWTTPYLGQLGRILYITPDCANIRGEHWALLDFAGSGADVPFRYSTFFSENLESEHNLAELAQAARYLSERERDQLLTSLKHPA